MVFLLVGAGLWLSVASGFLPLRRPGQVLQATLGSFFRRRSGKEEGMEEKKIKARQSHDLTGREDCTMATVVIC